MHPFEKQSADLPPGVSRHLDLRLKPGWHLDQQKNVLVSSDGERVSLRGILAPAARVIPMVPSLSKKTKRRKLSDDEHRLAQYLQVILPPDADPADIASSLRQLKAFESVAVPPQIGLP